MVMAGFWVHFLSESETKFSSEVGLSTSCAWLTCCIPFCFEICTIKTLANRTLHQNCADNNKMEWWAFKLYGHNFWWDSIIKRHFTVGTYQYCRWVQSIRGRIGKWMLPRQLPCTYLHGGMVRGRKGCPPLRSWCQKNRLDRCINTCPVSYSRRCHRSSRVHACHNNSNLNLKKETWLINKCQISI